MKKITVFFILCAITAISTAQSTRPMVSNIRASVAPSRDHTIVTWTLNPDAYPFIQDLLVYRKEGSIINSTNVTSESPVAVLQIQETKYLDYANNRKNYYYAIVARKQNGLLYDIIIPTVNATTSIATRTAESTQPTTKVESRGQSLAPVQTSPRPPLNVLPEQKIENTRPLTRTTLTYSDNFIFVPPTISSVHPDILPQDESDSNAIGDDYTLFLIVDLFISQDEWITAEAELIQFLQINRSKEITARANFYLGQAYYFNGKYREALACFQQSEKLYPIWSRKWIEATLANYRID